MPLKVLVAVTAFTLVSWVPGVPLALMATRRSRTPLTVVLVVAAGLGTAVWLLIGLPAVHMGWFRPLPMVAAGAAVACGSWVLARHEVRRLRPGRPGPLAIYLAVLAVPALVLRSAPVYFAYQVADFGEYVNRGNVLADGGRFGGWFVNGFPLLLGEASLLLGEARSVYVMPFVGGIVAASILAVLFVARVHRVVIGIVAIPLALHVHAVWFSQFPASETLYAALLITGLLLVAIAFEGNDRAVAGGAGLLGFHLILVRGNGLMLLGVALFALAVLPLIVESSRDRLIRSFLVALTCGLWIGALYDARYNPTYFLEHQIVRRAPGPAGDLFARLDEPFAAAGLSAMFLLALAGAVVTSVAIRRRVQPRVLVAVGSTVLPLVVGLAAAIHLIALPAEAYLIRYQTLGPFAWGSVVVALAAWTFRWLDDALHRFLVGWSLLVAATMGTLMMRSMEKSVTVDGPWFLYWDRYFFSEVFPMVLVAGGVAASVLWGRWGVGEGWRRPTALVALAGVVLLGVIDLAGPTRNATRATMFADAYGELHGIVDLMTEPIPIVYDGLTELPAGWFWPNSSRVLAEPIRETFGRRVLNPAAVLADDPRPSPEEVADLLIDAGTTDGYVLQVSHEPAWQEMHGDALDAVVKGQLLVPIERLEGRSSVRPEDQRWITSDLWIRVVRVSVVQVPAP